MERNEKVYQVIISSGANDRMFDHFDHYILSNKRYRIVYQIIGNQVFVDDLQDCRQGDDKSALSK